MRMLSLAEASALLGVDQDAPISELNRAYKRLARQYHPDKLRDQTPENIAKQTEIMQRLNAAYDLLNSNRQEARGVSEEISLKGHQGNDLTNIEQSHTVPMVDVGQSSNRIIPDEFYEGANHIKIFDFELKDTKNVTSDIYNLISNKYFSNSAKSKYDHSHLVILDKERITTLIQEKLHTYDDIENKMTDKSFLWVATKPGCAPIYLFGTMHRFSLDFDNYFRDVLENIIEKVDCVCTEVESKSDLLFDARIAEIGSQMNKILRPLEDDYIFSTLVNLTDLPKEANQSDIDELSRQFLTNIVPENAIFDDLNGKKEILYAGIKRNLLWMHQILRQSNEEQLPTLVACGALHLHGKYGLPNLLKFEGYDVKPLMKKAPVSRNEIHRFFQSGVSPVPSNQAFEEVQVRKYPNKTK